jgi:hypothetical protein
MTDLYREMHKDAEKECWKLRATIATLTAERDEARAQLDQAAIFSDARVDGAKIRARKQALAEAEGIARERGRKHYEAEHDENDEGHYHHIIGDICAGIADAIAALASAPRETEDMSPAVAQAMKKFEQALAWRRHVEAMIAPASPDPRDVEIERLLRALSECGQRRLSTEADNRRLRAALEEK